MMRFIVALLAAVSLNAAASPAFELESATSGSYASVASGSVTGAYGNGYAYAGNSAGAYNYSGASVDVTGGVVTTGAYSFGADGTSSYAYEYGNAYAGAGAGAYQSGFGSAYGDYYHCCH